MYTKSHKNQTKIPKTKQLSQEFLDDPEAFISQLPPLKRNLLNYILRFYRKYGHIYFSQIKASKDLGYSRQHINYAIRDFVKMGILSKKQRWNTSCIYEVSSIFDCPDIKQKLHKLLPSLWSLSIALLLSFCPMVTVSNIKILGKEFYNSAALRRKLMDNQAVIRADIERIKFKSIELTRLGKIKLMAFSKEVIQKALEKLRNANDVRNPYQYLYKLCLQECEIEHIDPDFKYVGYLSSFFGISQDGPDFTTKGNEVKAPPEFKHMYQKQKNSFQKPYAHMYKPWKEHNVQRYSLDREQVPLSFNQKQRANEFLSILGITENCADFNLHKEGIIAPKNKIIPKMD